MSTSQVDTGSRNRSANLWDRLRELRISFRGLTLYESFEHAVILVLTGLIIAIVASATWHLAEVVALLILTDEVHPAN